MSTNAGEKVRKAVEVFDQLTSEDNVEFVIEMEIFRVSLPNVVASLGDGANGGSIQVDSDQSRRHVGKLGMHPVGSPERGSTPEVEDAAVLHERTDSVTSFEEGARREAQRLQESALFASRLNDLSPYIVFHILKLPVLVRPDRNTLLGIGDEGPKLMR